MQQRFLTLKASVSYLTWCAGVNASALKSPSAGVRPSALQPAVDLLSAMIAIANLLA